MGAVPQDPLRYAHSEWRRFLKAGESFAKEIEPLIADPLTGRVFAVEWLRLLDEQRLRFTTQLRDSYGFDVDAGQVIDLAKAANAERHQMQDVLSFILGWIYCKTMIASANEAARVGQDIPRTLLATAQRLNEILPALQGAFIDVPDQEVQASYTHALSGWAVTQLSLWRNRRLRAALSGKVGNPFQALLRQIDAAVFLAWQERSRGERLTGPHSFRSRIACHLENRDKVRSGSDDSTPDQMLDDQQLREDASADERAEWLRRLTESGLSAAEAEVVYLCKIEGLSEKEVAKQRGVSLNTVQSQRKNARRKLATKTPSKKVAPHKQDHLAS